MPNPNWGVKPNNMAVALYNNRKRNKSDGSVLIPKPPRFDLSLNGTNYAQTDTPITLTGDFEVEAEISITSRGVRMAIFASTDDFGIIVRFETNGTVSLFVGTNSSWVILTLTTNTIPSLNDRHKVLLKRTGDEYAISVDGETPATALSTAIPFNITDIGRRISKDIDFFSGIIYSVKITDLVTPSNNLSWKLDSGNINREKSEEFPEDSTKDLIYFNVNEVDWGIIFANAVKYNGEFVIHKRELVTHGN